MTGAAVSGGRTAGRLVLVVGPSGAGKDTLLAQARTILAADPRFVFPRRIISRPDFAGEEHIRLDPYAFDAFLESGGAALSWSAHGLRYAVPASIDGEIEAGRAVVCNVSRGVVAYARSRYAEVRVVYVTAPAEIRAQRLRNRGRASDGEIGLRIARQQASLTELRPDLIIHNVGDPGDIAQSLVSCLRRTDRPLVVSVNSSPSHTFSKPARGSIRLLTGLGVEGDAHLGPLIRHRSRVARDGSKPNLRQVHLIHQELFDDLASIGFAVAPGELGENLTTRGIDLLALPLGARLHIGASAVIDVTGLRNPCRQLDNVKPGLMAATLGRDGEGRIVRKAGIMGVVLAGGEIRATDPIRVEVPAAPFLALKPV